MATRRNVLLGTLSTVFAGIVTSPARAAASAPVRIVAFGDSLTAGYGLPADAAMPVRLERALRAEGRDVRLINAGISGDTTAGGLARLDWALAEKPDLAIIELGANDGLRGIDPKLTEANLDAILTRMNKAGIGVLLAGMLAPPNYGRDFETAFNAVFPRLAKAHGVVFYPFYLDGVAGKPELNQPDGLHPTAAGIDVIVARILPSVRTLLDRFAARTADRSR
ncbi:arylesterase [Magnetospirillum molischianum]|uniref:Multifunctional: acyl-CoA thioesterase I protease I lysophospholipaseL(I) n=1 Tax=Magnetospirillum molischianum DSM 120 TaxID=1150626 RepID=H8FX85_MAGML|nr:arylesterase [Magnetospirillum molischianum]CCG42973.1 multifunctional: acyl-CoA thioesterase I; protease I; lysophospholipaseL(I) [Magnetospirillum molischianum DSM 120]